jgi:hypothetical protein
MRTGGNQQRTGSTYNVNTITGMMRRCLVDA